MEKNVNLHVTNISKHESDFSDLDDIVEDIDMTNLEHIHGKSNSEESFVFGDILLYGDSVPVIYLSSFKYADFDGTIAHCAIYDFANNKVIQQMNFGSHNLKKVGHVDKRVEEKLSKEIDP
jgi:hypothetical protein